MEERLIREQHRLDEQMIREAAEREATARLESAESRREGEGEVEREREDEREREGEAAPGSERRGGPPRPQPQPAIEREPAGARPAGARGSEQLLADLERTEGDLDSRREDEQQLATELEAAERRLGENQRATAEAIERAAARLEEVEERAREAEERAGRAERLGELQRAESEQAGRLEEMLNRIAAAEDRASAAQARAREAVQGVGGPGTAPDSREAPGEQRPG